MASRQTIGAVLAPVHLLFYSTLLGAELYQSFVMTKVCYDALPRSAFTTLQKRVFPLYFRGQTVVLVLAAATIPPHGLASAVQCKSDWIPFVIAGVTAVLNLALYEPRTRQAMVDRIHQGENINGYAGYIKIKLLTSNVQRQRIGGNRMGITEA